MFAKRKKDIAHLLGISAGSLLGSLTDGTLPPLQQSPGGFKITKEWMAIAKKALEKKRMRLYNRKETIDEVKIDRSAYALNKRLMKLLECYRAGIVLDMGVKLNPIQIVENNKEIIINCANLDYAMAFDKKLFKECWANKV